MLVRKIGVATAGGLAVLALAACSSNATSPGVASVGGSGATTTTTMAGSSDPAHVWAQWAACMRQHGAQISDPTLNAQNQPQFDQSQLAAIPESVKTAARQACQSIIANLQAGTPSKTVDPQKALAIARCMRSHSVTDFPDPDPSTGDLVVPLKVQSEPAFAQAYATCKSAGS